MLGRLMNVLRGFFAQFVTGVEKRNPEALLELEQENLRKQIGSYNQSLAVHAGLAERGTGFEEVPNSPSAAGPSQV